MAEFRQGGVDIRDSIEPYRFRYDSGFYIYFNKTQPSTTKYNLRLQGHSFDYGEVTVLNPTSYHVTLSTQYGSFNSVPDKGYLPTNNLITRVYNSSTTSTIYRYFVQSGGYCYLSTSSSSASGTKLVPSDATAIKPQLFAIALQGGGGGGAGGDGGGGGGGGYVSFLVRYSTLYGCYIAIGNGGKGTVHNVSDPTNGGMTKICYSSDSYFAYANGGACGKDGNHGQIGGTGGSYYTSGAVFRLAYRTGGKGGNIGASGNPTTTTTTTIPFNTYTGQSSYTYGGTKGGTGSGGGGGGASAMYSGANASDTNGTVPKQPLYGGGGGGTGKTWLGIWWNAGNGGGGAVDIFY